MIALQTRVDTQIPNTSIIMPEETLSQMTPDQIFTGLLSEHKMFLSIPQFIEGSKFRREIVERDADDKNAVIMLIAKHFLCLSERDKFEESMPAEYFVLSYLADELARFPVSRLTENSFRNFFSAYARGLIRRVA